jgi:protoporphyrinogen oxidase
MSFNQKQQHCKYLVIGAGLAGLSVAYFLEKKGISDYLVIEKESFVGGKARSEFHEGFTFDVTGHWLHLRNAEIKKMVYELMPEEAFAKVDRISRIWSHGVYTEYPFQGNLYGLPPHIIKDCLLGAIQSAQHAQAQQQNQEPVNFEAWIIHYFGQGIADQFMLPYNQKLWGVKANEITSLWCQRFVPKPKLDEIVAGAVGCNQLKMGYNASFIYPKTGGIQSLANAIERALPASRILKSHEVISINHAQKSATIKQGEVLFDIQYECLINTNALPLLIDQIDQKPLEISHAKQELRANEVVYLNMGIAGKLKQKDHWIYVPELEWPVYRIGSFSNAVESMAPVNHSNLYIELSDRTTPVSELMPKIHELLIKMDLLDKDQEILFTQERRIKNAYVIYDFKYAQARSTIHQWLNAHQIYSIGRYGDWNYSSMEDALIDGMKLVAHFASSPQT